LFKGHNVLKIGFDFFSCKGIQAQVLYVKNRNKMQIVKVYLPLGDRVQGVNTVFRG
jgi:hypothetical protein